jgi:hypothetical protein
VECTDCKDIYFIFSNNGDKNTVDLALKRTGSTSSWSFFRYSSNNEENPCTPSSENQRLVLGYVHCAVNDYYYWTYNPWNLRKYKSIILLVQGLYASGPKKIPGTGSALRRSSAWGCNRYLAQAASCKAASKQALNMKSQKIANHQRAHIANIKLHELAAACYMFYCRGEQPHNPKSGNSRLANCG